MTRVSLKERLENMKQKVAGMDKHEKVKENFKKIHNYVIANFAVTEYNKNRKV